MSTHHTTPDALTQAVIVGVILGLVAAALLQAQRTASDWGREGNDLKKEARRRRSRRRGRH
jgi:hypothetical protein